jgi:predicted GH43/DUF377 family glycosyl hydrolase
LGETHEVKEWIMKAKWTLVWVGVCLIFPSWGVAQTEWVEVPGNPVIPTSDIDAWDYNSYVDTVVAVDGTYHLFYRGQRRDLPLLDEYSIGHATSTDGVDWVMDPANPVLVPGDEGAWDADGVASAAVIHDGTEFRMWYVGGVESVSAVGYATSPDGTTWTKHPGNPVMASGPSGTFDDGGAWPGTVMYDGAKYRMWYTAERDADDYIWNIGYAESPDGLEWTRHPEPVIEAESGWNGWVAYEPAVVYDGTVFRMWYAGHSGSWISVGHAVSTDGIQWTQYWGNPVIDEDVALDVSSVLVDEVTGEYRMWVTNVTDRNFYAFTSECCSTVHASIIPAVAYAAGAEGSFYETDLDLSNAGAFEAEYRFTFLPRAGTTEDPLESDPFTLGAGKSVRYENVLSEVFDLESDVFGAMVIDSTSQGLMAVARIANTPQEPAAGSFGQAMPAISPGVCTGLDEKRRLLFGTEHAEMRFNVGCLNFNERAARINFELYRSDGSLLGSESLILMPWSNDQLNRIFDPYHPVTGYVDYWSDISTGSVYCYGSVLDNVTSDPMTVPPM